MDEVSLCPVNVSNHSGNTARRPMMKSIYAAQLSSNQLKVLYIKHL